MNLFPEVFGSKGRVGWSWFPALRRSGSALHSSKKAFPWHTRRKGQANGTRHRTAAHANADERLHILEAALAEFSRAVEWIDKDGDPIEGCGGVGNLASGSSIIWITQIQKNR